MDIKRKKIKQKTEINAQFKKMGKINRQTDAKQNGHIKCKKRDNVKNKEMET